MPGKLRVASQTGGFLIREQAAIPPQAPGGANVSHILASQTPRSRRPDPSGISKTQSRPSGDRSQSY